MILVYNMDALDNETMTKLMILLNNLGEPWRQLHKYNLTTKVEDLLSKSHTNISNEPSEAPDTTFMLIDGDEAFVDRLLAGLKEKEIKIPYKAVVTENNRKWTLDYLIHHVMDEDREVKALMQLQRFLQASVMFQQSDYDEEAWADFVAAREKAEAFLESVPDGDITPEEAEAMVKAFNSSVLEMLGKGAN